MKTSTAIAALVTAIVGFGSVLPVLAQDAAPATPPAVTADQNAATPGPGPGGDHGMHKPGQGMGKGQWKGGKGMGFGGMQPGGRLLALACSPKGAEELDVAFTRAQHRLALTADQQKLFDAFRTKALTTETTFADACKTARPAPADGAKPDMLAQLKAGMAIDQARLTALTDVLPEFTALFNSLTDDQKTKLLPHHGMGQGKGPGMGMKGDRHGDRGGMPRTPDAGRN